MNGRAARQHTAGGKAGIKKQRAEGDRAEARDAGAICSLDRDRDGNHFDCGKKRKREGERAWLLPSRLSSEAEDTKLVVAPHRSRGF